MTKFATGFAIAAVIGISPSRSVQLPDPTVSVRMLAADSAEITVAAAARPTRVKYFGRVQLEFYKNDSVAAQREWRLSSRSALSSGAARTASIKVPTAAVGADSVKVGRIQFCGGSIRMFATGEELPCD